MLFQARFHLPDVTCSNCGKEISPVEIYKHRKECKKVEKNDQDEVEKNIKGEEIEEKIEDSFCGNDQQQQAENPFYEEIYRTSVRMVFEGKKYTITLDKNKSMKKAMRKMASTLGRDCKSLLFKSMDNESIQLTGRERVGKMEGIKISVSVII